MAADAIGMDNSSDQISGETRKLICHNQNTSEQLHTFDCGTFQIESSGKTNERLGSEFLDNKLGTGAIKSFIDEKSWEASNGMTENSVIQTHYESCKSCQNGEGSCFQHNNLEQADVIGMEAPLDQMSSKPRELMYHNNNTLEQLHILDPGTTQFELPEKTNQAGSESLDNEQRVPVTGETASLLDEKSSKFFDSMAGNFVTQLPAQPQCDLDKSCQTEEGSCFQHNTLELGDAIGMDASKDHLSDKTRKLMCHNNNNLEQLRTLDPGSAHFKMSEKLNQTGSEFLNGEQSVPGTGEINSLLDEKQLTVSDSMAGDSVIQLPAQSQCELDSSWQNGRGSCFQYNSLKQVSGSLSNDESQDKHQLASQSVQNEPMKTSGANERLDPPSEDIAKCSSPDSLRRNSKRATHVRSGFKDKKTATSLKKKYMLRSSDRILRSRKREKPDPPKSNTNLVNVNHVGENRRKSKKNGEGEKRVTDEFSRIRARLKYFLNRVSYEQSLIDAYSGEGWKGYSMEKLKPEKELHRAKSEILRLKLKIRDLFRHLDTLCAEGRLPQSLFDSEGEICSEDIFCAKCRSKDLTASNDIILCDGACDRGFHQLCLEPPLLSENIPPDDEGWLCPGCDCKDDCFDFLNDSLGTSLSICDAWERVFPEAAAAAGNKVDDNLGLPSDDSDDDDYNPDVSEHEEVEGGKSSSDESENASAYEEMEASRNEDPYLGLPSNDSEDNDYDPNDADRDKDVAEESLSSDFTSDSEDLADVVKGNALSGQDDDPISAPSLFGQDPDDGAFTPVSGKRHIERMDYKKLYDETYQNDPSDTSDDEDWTANTTLSMKKKFTSKGPSESPNEEALILDDTQKETEHTPRRNTHQMKVESPDKSLEVSKRAGSNDKKPRSSAYRRLGEDAVKVLYKNFQQNMYPDRATKESLAKELGLTFDQVRKWFENGRWSFRNSSRMEAMASKTAPQLATSSRVENDMAPSDEKRDSKAVSPEGNIQELKSRGSRKRKQNTDAEESNANVDIDSASTNPLVHSPRVEVQRSHKMKTRKRK